MELVNIILQFAFIVLLILGLVYRHKAYTAAGETDQARGLIVGFMSKTTGWINDKSYIFFRRSELMFFLAFFSIALRFGILYFNTL
jgi:hypothetical protein